MLQYPHLSSNILNRFHLVMTPRGVKQDAGGIEPDLRAGGCGDARGTRRAERLATDSDTQNPRLSARGGAGLSLLLI